MILSIDAKIGLFKSDKMIMPKKIKHIKEYLSNNNIDLKTTTVIYIDIDEFYHAFIPPMLQINYAWRYD